MDILKSRVFRAFDLAIIWMLLSGQESWSQFAVFVCYVFVVIAFLGLVTFKKEAVDSFPSKTWFALFVGWVFHLLYTGALIQSGHPILAGFYLLGFFALRMRVSALRKEAAQDKLAG